jgi:ABC-type transport system involved in multi-copper enzyme maturation permease subunit
MISKGIMKFTLIRFYREYMRPAFYLSSMIIFLIICALDPPFLQLESMGNYIYGRTFFFNLIVALSLSAGILGREIGDGFMAMIVSKPVKRESIYITKFLATLIYGTSLLIIYLAILTTFILFIHKVNLQFSDIFKAFLLLFFDQLAVVALSIFLSSFTQGDMNILLLILIEIGNSSLYSALSSSPLKNIYKFIYDFLNIAKGFEIRESFLSNNIIPLKFFIEFIAFTIVFTLSGIYIFKRIEIRR